MSEACAKLEQVRGCNAVEEPCSSGVQREPQPRYRMRQQRIPEEDQPGHAQRTRSKMKYMQQYVKEQLTHLLAT